MKEREDRYTAVDIQVLEGLEAVRKRPGMYIGSTGPRGLHHLVFEVVDNSIDEAVAGYCDQITVTIHQDNRITVTDNGRGIPVDIHPKMGIPALEVILTTLHSGAKFGGSGYSISGGLHGVGLSVVNALSSFLEVQIARNGKLYYQRYEKGRPVTSLQVVGTSEHTGTRTTFLPDDTIFEETDFSADIIATRLRELAYLNQGVKIILLDERMDLKQEYHYTGGIRDFVRYLNTNKDVVNSEPIYFSINRDDTVVAIAIQYNTGYSETLLSYANNIRTQEGGTHEIGFKNGLTRIMNDYAKGRAFLKRTTATCWARILEKEWRLFLRCWFPNLSLKGRPKPSWVIPRCAVW